MFRRGTGSSTSSPNAHVLADELREAIHMSDDESHSDRRHAHANNDDLSSGDAIAYAITGLAVSTSAMKESPRAIERRNLLCVLQHAVRHLLDGSVGRVIDDSDDRLSRFSAILEATLDHGIRSGKKKWLAADKGGYYGFFEPVLRHARSPIAESVREMSDVKTARGKGRAFIRHALMEKRLAQYVQAAIAEAQLLSDWYEDWAVMRNEQSQVLVGVLVGLNAIDFGFCLRGVDLDSPEMPIDYAFFLEATRRRMQVKTPDASDDRAADEGKRHAHSQQSECETCDSEVARRITALHEQKAYLEELVRTKEMALENESRAHAASLRELAHATARVNALAQQLADERHESHEIIIELQRQMGVNADARRLSSSGSTASSGSYGDRTRHTFAKLPDSVLGL